jgi:hypothetical protein
MRRDDFDARDGTYVESGDRDTVRLLTDANAYMEKTYKASQVGEWSGPGPGLYFGYFRTATREFKVKTWWYPDDATMRKQKRLEVVEVLERAILP